MDHLHVQKRHGAARIEAYPRTDAPTEVERYMGIAEVLLPLGFREIERRKPERPILRLELT